MPLGKFWPTLEQSLRNRIMAGQATDRDRWICLRKSYAPDLSAGFAGQEYDRLISDKRVRRLEVTEEEGICLYTNWIVRRLYDEKGRPHKVFIGSASVRIMLPKYSLKIGSLHFEGPVGFVVKNIETGSYKGHVPPYYLVAGHGFCFGDRTEYLEELANRGEFFQFYMAVLESLWHINPSGAAAVIKTHRKLLEDNSVEAGSGPANQGDEYDGCCY